MKYTDPRPFADPDKAARTLLEFANTVEAFQDGRIHIEKINGPFLFQLKGTPAEYKAGLDLAIAKGWLVLHEIGTFVRLTDAGAALLHEPRPARRLWNQRPSHLVRQERQWISVVGSYNRWRHRWTRNM